MRVCLTCNFKMPDSYRGRRCKRCKAVLDKRLCSHCLRLKASTEFYDDDTHPCCKACYTKINFDNYHVNTVLKREAIRAEYKHDTDKALVDWLSRINKPTRLLTETEWHKACSYFNGCAICGDESIEVRWIFVPPQLFGKGSYTACNVIPVCGKCGEVVLKKDLNPFSYMGTQGIDQLKGNIDHIVDYLQMLLEDDNNAH